MTNGENAKRKTLPPYIPFKTFLSFIDSLKVGIPGRIDKSVMKSMSGGAQSGLINALSFMKLISSDGVPTQTLTEIVKSSGEDRQNFMADCWSATYGFLFDAGIDLDTASPKQVEEGLARAGAGGETVLKCRAFMQAMAKTAGISISPHLGKVGRRPRSTKPRKVISSQEANNGGANHQPLVAEKTPEQFLIDILDTLNMDEAEQQAVWTLIKYLKKQVEED